MINGVELEIVKMYIVTNKPERLIWELSKPQKRQHIMIRRFASPEIFEKSWMRSVDYMSSEELKKCLSRLSRAKEVYFIGESYIGELSLDQATLRANAGELCIIYCGNGLGYYQGEQEYGKPPRYLLQRE